MKNNLISKIIAVVVALAGITVMIGWIFDITVLKSILPQFVTMKFNTAFCFFLSGMSLYFITDIDHSKHGLADIILVFINFLIILIMFSLLISIFVGIRTGMEDLFVKEALGAVYTFVPGRPALFTIISFILVAGAGLMILFKGKISFKIARIFGLAVAGFGGLAVIGYIVNIPQFYGHFNNYSTAMALHTAILFALLGIGFFIIKSKNFYDTVE